MARIPAGLGLTAEELDELMTTSWNMRVATIGPGERINLTPLWFGWAAGRVYFFGRGQKIANLRRSPSCTVLVDRNEQYAELEGAMFQGNATVLETAEHEDADAHLEEVRWSMGAKYSGGHGETQSNERVRYPQTASGRSARWVVFEPGTRGDRSHSRQSCSATPTTSNASSSQSADIALGVSESRRIHSSRS